MTKLFMMVGLPASGKSYQANILSKKHNAKIFSSDEYRSVLGSSEEDQTVTQHVFNKLISDIKLELKSNNAIFDATNINSKKRRNFLKEISKLDCEKICVLVLRTYDNCLVANSNRTRKVPKEVITRMYKSFETPYLEEGWDKIDVIYTDNDSNCFGYPHKFIEKYIDYNQHNRHHRQTLGNHLQSTQDYITDNFIEVDNNVELYLSACIHDCGKPFCKTFVNKRGLECSDAHYYGHENVGAYDSLFYNFYDQDVDKLLISFLIANHMKPLTWLNSTKAEKRCEQNWGINKYNLIKMLHIADTNSSRK